jgi:phospholipid transport system substrate-binding protein
MIRRTARIPNRPSPRVATVPAPRRLAAAGWALAAATLGLAALLAAGAARAEAPAEPATPVIERLHDTILGAMKQADELGYEGRYERLEPVLRETFDFDFMAEKAVGRYWRDLSPEDRERMRDVFARFTLSTYANRFSGWSGERFETRAEDSAPRDTVFVRTELVRTDGEENVEINYRLRHTPEGWRVIDVLLRGTVSELALRRSEYSSVIKRDGFDALLASLEQKIADLAAGKVEDSPS